MSEKKMTAVEWFAQELNNWRVKEFGKDAVIGIPTELINQAKDIDKEQKEEFFKAGKKYAYGDSIAIEWGEETEELNFEEYYNKNFK